MLLYRGQQLLDELDRVRIRDPRLRYIGASGVRCQVSMVAWKSDPKPEPPVPTL